MFANDASAGTRARAPERGAGERLARPLRTLSQSAAGSSAPGTRHDCPTMAIGSKCIDLLDGGAPVGAQHELDAAELGEEAAIFPGQGNVAGDARVADLPRTDNAPERALVEASLVGPEHLDGHRQRRG